MRLRKPFPVWGIIPFIFFLSSCGELDTVFPTSGTYRVDALIGESSLGTCAVIGEKSDIYPYFINSVTNDPDVRGLTVSLQGPGGSVLGGKLYYTLNAGDIENLEKKSPPSEKVEPNPPPGESLIAGTEKGEDPPREGSGNLEKPEDKAVQNGSSSPAPVQAVQPGRIRIGTEDRQIPVPRLDMDLPPFSLPGGLEIGRYTMVFQVQGEREVLYRIEKPFYYTGDAEFTIEGIHSYLPGLSSGSPLIPPGTTVMLEARVAADKRLDPYVIWYNGRRRIGEGRLQDGANRLMWKAPDQTGFHHVRVELFPFRPLENAGGKVKELSLPVSSKQEPIGYFSEAGETFLRWYHFGGDLRDSKGGTDTALSPQGDTYPRWLPEGGIYGIALGPEDVYLLPGFPFTLAEGEQGKGRFMLRFKPMGEGTILKASFKAGNSSLDILDLSLYWTGDALKLALTSNGETHTALTGVEFFDREDFIAVNLNFSIRGTVFSAALKPEHTGLGTEEKAITLPAALSGVGTVQLGASQPKWTASGTEDSPPQAFSPALPTAILDEIALIYTIETLSGEIIRPFQEMEEISAETAPLLGKGENSGPA